MRERAVVREQQRACRVGIESSDWHYPRRVWHELDDGLPSVRVTSGRDDIRGLVEEHIREGLRRYALAVDLDDVARAHDRVQLAARSVDVNPPGDDELVRAPARGDSGASEVRVEPHLRIFTSVR